MRAEEAPHALNVCLPIILIILIMLAPQSYQLFRKLCPHISRIPTQRGLGNQTKPEGSQSVHFCAVILCRELMSTMLSPLEWLLEWSGSH